MRLGKKLRASMALAALAIACGDRASDSDAETQDGGSGGAGGSSGSSGSGGGAGLAGGGGTNGWAASAGAGAESSDAGLDADDAAAADAASDAAIADPCAAAENGDHCGGTLGADPEHLYTCTGGATTAEKSCANGCFKATAEPVCASKCCIKRPPGYTVAAGVWNACPFKSSVSNREHMAIDYASSKGTPIPASMDGTIQYIRNKGDPNCYNGGCSDACLATGNTIVLKAACGDPLKPGNDLYLRYHHIDDVAPGIKQGTKVARGTIIATVGDSGCATAPHIHFQVSTHPKGTYSIGQLPSFWDCASTKDPTTRLCSTLEP